MKKLILAALLLSAQLSLSAQNYKNAVGVQIGEPLGIAYKYHPNRNAAEVVAGMAYMRGYYVGALYEYHIVQKEQAGLYIGVGGSYLKWPQTINNEYYVNYQGKEAVGINSTVGVDWAHPKWPLVASLSWTPRYDVAGDWQGDFYLGRYSVSIKYRLN